MLRVLFEANIFKLRSIQKEAIKKGLFFRKSFLVCAPSGSGKTLIGEICAIYNIFQGFGKSIYLVPFKALATEKYYHFKKAYSRFKINIELSIGDFDVDDKDLQNADVIITTYEKMDSILRNFYDKQWIFDISTIIIDEIHIIGESSRGPRLESLIVRMNEFLKNPQIIGLSATIANPEFFNRWLNSLGNNTVLIKSNKRPVKLHYEVKVTQNKNSTIKKIVNETLADKGQVLIFLNKRIGTQKNAIMLKSITKNKLEANEKQKCLGLTKELSSIQGGHHELQKAIKNGVAFHHAGLLSKERKIIEDNYRKGLIKVICCTTTLSAGVNTPARVVILRDFKKFIRSGNYITDFSGYHEEEDGFSYFMPFSPNEVFQMLGRAGRPGLDTVGYGIILTNSIKEKGWVEDYYFDSSSLKNQYIPRYEDLLSGLNNINTLKEQVLLRLFEEQRSNIEDLINFFEKTYFWFIFHQKMHNYQIPIEQLLLIKEITPENILYLHANNKRLREIKEKNLFETRISKLDSSNISGYVKSKYGLYFCEFDVDNGIRCSCGFKNSISDNFVAQKFVFEFCDHITAFLIYILEYPNMKLQKFVNDIVPKSIKNQYILNYLFEKGLILKDDKKQLYCSQFGRLIIRLYLYPDSGVLIRNKLQKKEISNYQELIREAYDILLAERRVKNMKMLNPILDWIDEEPLERITERYKIMTGDLFGIKENLERIITFISIIASFLSSSGSDIINDMIYIAEIAETLKIRLHHGIKEELFDLVLKINNVGRARARILYDAGFHNASKIKKLSPYYLNRKTGLGVNLCKNIIKDLNANKIKQNQTY